MFFVIRSEKTNELFDSKKDFLKVIKTIKNPLVKTFSSKEAALYFLNDPRSIKAIKEEYELEKRLKKEARAINSIESLRNKNLTRFCPKDEYIGFIDVEAGKNKAISIGLIIFDTKRDIEMYRFYSLLKPFKFDGVDDYCRNLTGISTEEIMNAKNYDVIYNEVEELLKKYNVKQILCWGNADRVFIKNSLPTNHPYTFVNKIINIQADISSITVDLFVNKCWSLQNMKRILNIDNNEVQHNALSDTLDLLKVFKAWKNMQTKDINQEFILEYAKRAG